MANGSYDAAYGAMLGAFVGDAAGAVLEFQRRRPTPDEVDDALLMPGGGVWKVGPGQITDDSELALCLAQALLHRPPSAVVPLDEVGKWYGRWLSSPPFDIGITTRQALAATIGFPADQQELGQAIVDQAAQVNQGSLSNGALMRITPLAVWGHRLPQQQLVAAARMESSLTHPNIIAQDASAAYCLAVAHLIKQPGDARGAVQAAESWAQQEQVSVEVMEWLQEAAAPGPGPDTHDLAGFVKWAFIHAFRALRLESSVEEALRHVLSLGGDTDTNAAIVGGLVGALKGAASIPGAMKDPVLSRQVGSPGRRRPAFLQSGLLPTVFEQLYETTTLA